MEWKVWFDRGDSEWLEENKEAEEQLVYKLEEGRSCTKVIAHKKEDKRPAAVQLTRSWKNLKDGMLTPRKVSNFPVLPSAASPIHPTACLLLLFVRFF